MVFHRSAFCEAHLSPDLLREFLPRLIDVSCTSYFILSNFVVLKIVNEHLHPVRVLSGVSYPLCYGCCTSLNR